MDIGKVTSGNGKLVLMFPGTTTPIGLTLEVQPPDTPELKKYVRNQRDKHRALAQRGRPVQTADEERWSREMAITAVVGWEWTEDGDGKPGNWKGEQPDFSKDLLAELVEIEWIRPQIDVFLGDEKNFFRA